MVNGSLKDRAWLWALAPCALVLLAAAWLRGAEYDEQYTLFLTSGVPRPDWPEQPFPAGLASALQSGHSSLLAIARDLRITDVHPPLYFWLVSLWRGAFGHDLFAARILSVVLGLGALALVGAIARRARVPPVRAMLLTLGCYGFTYTSVVARGFALAEFLLLAGVACLPHDGRRWRYALAGVLFGAATFSNYLAVFTACAFVLAIGTETMRPRRISAGTRQSRAVDAEIVTRSSCGASLARSVDPRGQIFQHGGRAEDVEGHGGTGNGASHDSSGGMDLGPSTGSAMKPTHVASIVDAWSLASLRNRSSVALHVLRSSSVLKFLPASAPAQDNTRPDDPASGACENRVVPAQYIALMAGFLIFIPADLWWFLAQSGTRPDQFQRFSIASAVPRLVTRFSGGILGGLPLYLNGTASLTATVFLGLLLAWLLTRIVWRWRDIATERCRSPFALAALATPVGLLLLGAIFDNTPIEVRYLAFSAPFVALLLAGALNTRGAAVLLTVQAASIAGLMLAPRTMQPARAAARQAAVWTGDGIVLLPNGNDGVGVVGAFAIEAPPELPLLLIGPNDTPDQIRARLGAWHRVVLALLEQDAASRAAGQAMRRAMAEPPWKEVARAPNVAVYDRDRDQSDHASIHPSAARSAGAAFGETDSRGTEAPRSTTSPR